MRAGVVPLVAGSSSARGGARRFRLRCALDALDALDAQRRDRGLEWYPLADRLWAQSAELNARRTDHPLCGGAIQRLPTRGATSCQYALFMLRWLRRAPEDFLVGPMVDIGDVALPEAGPDKRLRWDPVGPMPLSTCNAVSAA